MFSSFIRHGDGVIEAKFSWTRRFVNILFAFCYAITSRFIYAPFLITGMQKVLRTSVLNILSSS